MTQSTSLDLRRRSRMRNLRSRAEREGARLQFIARTGSLLAVGFFFALVGKWNAALYFVLAELLALMVLGWLQYRLARRREAPAWIGYVIGTLDVAVITALIIIPNPFGVAGVPPAMQLRESGFKYLIIFVCLGALTLSPRLALWLGVAAALAWLGGVLWVAFRPGTIIPATQLYGMPLEERLRFYLNPNFLDAFDQAANVFVMLIIGVIIALVVSRSRRLADAYIKAERARSNLSRHFSPNVVDDLASEDEPFGPVRRQDVAVLFADIVGFTAYSEEHPAEDVFVLLRQFHRRMEQVVFDHGGTVDNYIGDCIMATFGVPRAGADDATRAIRCAIAMAASLDDLNAQRRTAGLVPIDVRIGAQYGPVVIGAVGSERNLSFAVVGDTVNVASRLQVLCRDLDARAAFGGALLEAARKETATALPLLAEDRGPIHLRGRDEPVQVWTLPLVAAITPQALSA